MLANIKIGARLKLGFGLVLALLGLMAALSAWQMKRLADDTDFYVVNLIPSYEVETRVAVAVGELRRFENRHVLANTDAEMDGVEARLAELRKAIAGELDRYARELIADEEDRAALAKVRSRLDAYYAEADKVRAVSRQTSTDPSKTAEAAAMLKGESSKVYEALQAAVADWFAYNVKLAAAQAKDARATYASARISLATMVTVALVLGVGAATLITRSITQPIERAVQIANTVAEGDLRSQIEVQGGDETAQLLRALAKMNESLSGIVGQVRLSSDSIATGSAQIAAGNGELSQRTEQQASNLQQTAASMEQLSGTVKSSAETASEASRLALAASSAATQGGDLVDQVVVTMQDIAASSRKIADIIGVIDGIAFQTNILALNAAVEAARAGEQGRGFAVVAGEVRSLASRSAEAAREIKSLIGASVEKVEAGTRQVNEAGASMGEIVGQVQRVSHLIGEISNAAGEQSAGIGQVGGAVSELDKVTQQNAALVEQSAAASESLKQQAARLADLVGVFKLAHAG